MRQNVKPERLAMRMYEKAKLPSKTKSEEYDRFEKLAKALIAVPKSEIDKRQTEYEKKKAAKKGRAA